MRNLKIKIVGLAITFLLFNILFTQCSENNADILVEPPSIIIGQIINITDSSASIGAQITFDGKGSVIERGVVFGEAPELTFTNNKVLNGLGTGAFQTIIEGLSPGKKYFVKAFATNSAGTSFSEEKSFETIKILPSITTQGASEITLTSAKVGGNITKDGGSEINARGVVFAKNSNPTLNDSKTLDGSGIGPFESNLTALQFSTKYYVRSYATNSIGTKYGNEISFTTKSPDLPTVTTNPVIKITAKFAFGSGNILSDGGGPIISSGLCWSTSNNPTIEQSKTVGGIGLSKLENLKGNTQYYVRAYATNITGTAYGNEFSFTTLPSITDIEGNIYNTVLIGNQLWMAENLRVTKFRNGNPIIGNFCSFENSTIDLNNGKQYNWYAATDPQGLCPVGTHLSSKLEWEALIKTFSSSLSMLTDPNGFNITYSGTGCSTDAFNQFGIRGWYSTSTPSEREGFYEVVWITRPDYTFAGPCLCGGSSLSALTSVRCIKD
jgi:uncharacterized protein (TIGR02145 family)